MDYCFELYALIKFTKCELFCSQVPYVYPDVHVCLSPAECRKESDSAPGHVCWHDLNMHARCCVKEVETGCWQLIYISNRMSGFPDRRTEKEREKETRVSNVCGLDVASPCGAKGLLLAGWYLWVTGQTSAGSEGTAWTACRMDTETCYQM